MVSISTQIRQMFDLTRPPAHLRRPGLKVARTLLPAAGELTLITGPSGSGKTRLLRSMRLVAPESTDWIDPTRIALPDEPTIETLCRTLAPLDPTGAIESSLALLARVGLAEAWTYLRKPAQLSDGQRWRLILAMMLARAINAPESKVTAMIVMDEYAALLDRVTANIVSRALRRLIDAPHPRPLSAVVVTSHDDLLPALDPDHHAICDFGEMILHRRKRVRAIL